MSTECSGGGRFPVAPIVLGVLLRAAWLPWVPVGAPIRDEAFYLDAALEWIVFGIYDVARPPGYAFLIAWFLRWFGEAGPLAFRALQVLLSVSIGWGVTHLARSAIGRRGATAAAWIWALYLPLGAYTHLLWPETVFLAVLLPAVGLLRDALVEPDASSDTSRLIVAGLLLGILGLIKDSSLVFPIALALLVYGLRRTSRSSAILSASLILAAALAPAGAWAVRNWDVYQRFTLTGSTAGMNAYVGMNAAYVNFDYDRRQLRQAYPEGTFVRDALLTSSRPGWERSGLGNAVDRRRENVKRGLRFMAEQPGFFLGSRLKKISDLLNPTSFVVRNLQRGRYHGPLSSPGLRVTLVVVCVLSSAGVMVLGWAGLVYAVPRGPTLAVIAATALAFGLPTVVNAMSRGRVPLEPGLLVGVAALLTHPGRALEGGWRRHLLFGTGAVVLGVSWWVDLPLLRIGWEELWTR